MKNFLSELPKNFTEIGQIAPSSRLLARSLSRPIRVSAPPRRILEVGAGTGSVTLELIRNLRPGDELVICEINGKLLEHLRQRLVHREEYQRHAHLISFVCLPVQELKLQERENGFDCIVSSLPFTNFTPDMVSEVLDLYAWLLKDDGALTFYEYVGLRSLGQLLRTRDDRTRVRGVAKVLHEWRLERVLKGSFRTTVTLLNIPPARTFEARY